MTVAAETLSEASEALQTIRSTGLWSEILRNVLRQRSAVVGLGMLAFLALVAILAPLIAPFDPTVPLNLGATAASQQGVLARSAPCIHVLGCPGLEHIFGVDSNFRDVFSRVVFGARISLYIGFVTVGFAIVVGSALGAIAGYAGGRLDTLIMRVMDILLVFPALLLAIAIVTVLGRGLINAQLAIGIVAIPVYARIMRASVLAVREQDFVTASRALGESGLGTLIRRVIPNSLTPIIVAGTLGVGGAVLDVAALSFIGLAAQPPTPEWGLMIGQDSRLIYSSPHLILIPGFAITLTVLGFNLFGDGLRDALDPRLHR
jgi:peptide/nickel transport system permease protein